MTAALIELTTEEEKYLWKYEPTLATQESTYLYLYTLGAKLDDILPLEIASELSRYREKVKAILLTYKTAKIEASNYNYRELIPEHVYERYEMYHSLAQGWVAKNVPKPRHYNILSKAHEVVEDIGSRRLGNLEQKVKYNIFGTKTGRLTTQPGSFPILTLPKKERSQITPQNDLLVEIDFNGAEVRTLLALSGTSLPADDIHSWNMKMLPPWLTREEAKEKFFAWLYNPASKEECFSGAYDKSIYKRHWKSGNLNTPYGREIEVEESKALNYLLQSTTSDIVVENTHKIMLQLKERESFLSFMMHDSVVLDFSSKDLAILNNILEEFKITRLGKYQTSVRIGKDYYNMREISNA